MEANTLSPLPSNLDKQNWILGNTIFIFRNVIFKNCVSYFTKFDHVDKMLSGKQSREKFAFLVCGLSDIVELFYLNLQFRTNCVLSIKGLFDILILFLLLWKWDFPFYEVCNLCCRMLFFKSRATTNCLLNIFKWDHVFVEIVFCGIYFCRIWVSQKIPVTYFFG